MSDSGSGLLSDYVYKLGEKVKNWKLRVVVWRPEEGAIHYLEPDEAGRPGRDVDLQELPSILPLGKIEVREGVVVVLDRNAFGRVKDSFLLGVTPKHASRMFVLEFATEERRQLWLNALHSVAQIKDLDNRPHTIRGRGIEGYMEKMGEKEKASGWKVRYFCLAQDTKELVYYKDIKAAQKQAKAGSIPLSLETVFEDLGDSEVLGKRNCFSLTIEMGHGRKFLISAADEHDKSMWCSHIKPLCAKRAPQ